MFSFSFSFVRTWNANTKKSRGRRNIIVNSRGWQQNITFGARQELWKGEFSDRRLLMEVKANLCANLDISAQAIIILLLRWSFVRLNSFMYSQLSAHEVLNPIGQRLHGLHGTGTCGRNLTVRASGGLSGPGFLVLDIHMYIHTLWSP